MLLKRKEKLPTITYDPARMIPVIRSSICTGEQAAGFRDRETGRFTEVALIRDEAGLNRFLRAYHISKDEIKKEW